MIKNEVYGPYEQWSMVVVYDPKTGHIVHTHQVVTTRGGTHPDKDTLEKQAAHHAARARNKSMTGMAFLHVDPKGIELDARYKVDVGRRSLLKTGDAKHPR